MMVSSLRSNFTQRTKNSIISIQINDFFKVTQFGINDFFEVTQFEAPNALFYGCYTLNWLTWPRSDKSTEKTNNNKTLIICYKHANTIMNSLHFI